jgi:hypothetical protein
MSIQNQSIEMSPIDSSGTIISIKNDEIKSELEKNIKETYIQSLEDKIDCDLGFYYWKKYVAAAFWANISTPINLCITLLTAVTTAQATAQNLFSSSLTSSLSVAAFSLTVFNTFFKPHLQMSQNVEIMNKWNKIGTEFELLFYDIDKYTQQNIFIDKYQEMAQKMNELRVIDGPDTTNFLTDFIHSLATRCCLHDMKWLDKNMKESFRNNNNE